MGFSAYVSRGALSSRLFGWIGSLLLVFVSLAATASADRLRGHVRHEFLEQIPVAGAKLDLVDRNDGTRTETLTTDEFGFFETQFFDEGDLVEITATHPAYAEETVEVTLGEDDTFEAVLMTPLGDLSQYHQVIVQIMGAVSQLPIARVPVELSQFDSENNVISTRNATTGKKGVAIFRGVPTGDYEFKLNDSSLPDAARRPPYEDYATPLFQRVRIEDNHFMNVFLKANPQDLKVRVTGFDFEEGTTGPLKDVLVQIRGLDPDDTTQEVLHPRSDFTKLFEADPPGTIDQSNYLITNGEVVFRGLPPVVYEVKISRYGYIT